MGGDAIVMLLEDLVVTMPAPEPVGEQCVGRAPRRVALLTAMSIAAKFTILNPTFLAFDTKFLVFDTQFLVLNTQFISFTHKGTTSGIDPLSPFVPYPPFASHSLRLKNSQTCCCASLIDARKLVYEAAISKL